MPRATPPSSGCCSATPVVPVSSEGPGVRTVAEEPRLASPSKLCLHKWMPPPPCLLAGAQATCPAWWLGLPPSTWPPPVPLPGPPPGTPPTTPRGGVDTQGSQFWLPGHLPAPGSPENTAEDTVGTSEIETGPAAVCGDGRWPWERWGREQRERRRASPPRAWPCLARAFPLTKAACTYGYCGLLPFRV